MANEYFGSRAGFTLNEGVSFIDRRTETSPSLQIECPNNPAIIPTLHKNYSFHFPVMLGVVGLSAICATGIYVLSGGKIQDINSDSAKQFFSQGREQTANVTGGLENETFVQIGTNRYYSVIDGKPVESYQNK
jgi:hypothetical protein